MRVGKKPNVVEAKKTRSCVVRLEKVAGKSPNVSPGPEDSRRSNTTPRSTRLSANTAVTMAPTPKLRRGVAVAAAATPQQQKTQTQPIKKRIVGSSSNNLQTPQTQQKTVNSSMTTNIRSNQKIKVIPRSNKSTPVSTPSRDETPPPTIAAGRSRRAIKPNPKYASEDLVTPKVVRNVASLGASTSRGGSVVPTGAKTRKASTSSDDFYNRNSEDDYDEKNDMDNDDDDDDIDEDADLFNDKAYQINEKEDNDDSDFSDIDEQPVRTVRPRGRPKRVQEPTPTNNNKLPTQTNVKRSSNISSSSTANQSSGVRSQPSQLQQIRRSLVTANNQRNFNLLAGSGGGGGATAQKRKLEETQDDSSDNEESSSYTIKRKQLLLSNASGHKVKVPVRENRVSATSTPFNKSRLALQKSTTPAHSTQQQTVNGSSNKFSNNQTPNPRRAIEISAKSNTQLRQNTNSAMNEQQQQQQKSQTNQTNLTTQAKLLAAKTNRLRSGSPKLANTQKNRQNNGSALTTISSTASSASTNSLNTNSKISDKAKAQQQSNVKTKNTTPAAAGANSNTINNSDNTIELKDDSPNSTMDDFETMPTFTIVNVNDIINKKGDVLITKTKSNNSNNNKAPTVIEFSESISLDDEEDEDDDNDDDDVMELTTAPPPKKLPKLPTLNRKEFENKKSSSTAPLTRSSESLRKLPTKPPQPAPQILNHRLGLRNTRVTAKTTTTLTATLTAASDKPAPRILNSMVAKKTQPVKPLIANMDDSADESFPLSLDEDEEEEDEREREQQQEQEEETEDEVESRFGKQRQQLSEKTRKRESNLMDEDTESQNTEEDESVLQTSNNSSSNKANYKAASSTAALTPKQNTQNQRSRRRMPPAHSNTPIVVSSNKKRLTPAAAKENSLAATNQQVNNETTTTTPLPATKQAIAAAAPTLPARNKTNEKVVISKQGDKIIKKITCFETWYVINMPLETKRPTIIRNQLEMPLIRLANNAKNICLPNDLWSTKVTLYELSPQTLGKGTYATFTGDLFEHNIKEEDRGKYQPSCVMFRRSIEKSQQISRMPYDRAVIFKNKTFYTNIEGKNVRLVGAPSIVNTEREIEILLQVVDCLTLQSDFVEHISIVQ